MPAATTYYNCPVLIGEGGPAGAQPSFFVAQQASIEETLPLLPVKSLGQTSVLNVIPENTLQGTISISYLLSAGTAGTKNSVTIANILDWSTIDRTIPLLLNGQIGVTRFQNAVLTSFSLDAGAQSVISCSLNLAYYKQSEALTDGGETDETLLDTNDLEYAHGANSTPDADELALNDNLFSFKFDLTESVSPIHILGAIDETQLLKGGGEAKMTWVGNNLPQALVTDPTELCMTARGASFTASSCGGAMTESITFPLTSKGDENAYMSNRSIDVSEAGVLNGTATLTQFY